MIYRLATKLTNHFMKKGTVLPEESEVYVYCFEIMISTILNLGFIVVCAICTGTYVESLLFSLGFMGLRGCAGGYHADSHWKCFLTLAVVYAGMVAAVMLLSKEVLFFLSLAFIGVTVLTVLLLAPVDSENKPLDEEETKKNKKKSALTVFLLAALYILLASFDATRTYVYGLSYATVCVSIMLMMGFFKNVWTKRKNARVVMNVKNPHCGNNGGTL